MFKRSGKLFLGSFGAALFALLLNFTLPVSLAIAAEDGSAGYLLEVCSASGVKPINFDSGNLAIDSIPAQDLTKVNHNLCSYCSIHHGGVSIKPGLLSSRLVLISHNANWVVTSATKFLFAALDLSQPTRGPPTA